MSADGNDRNISTTANQWRNAANVLREQAVLFDQRAEQAEQAAVRAICGLVSQSGPNLEPLACGYHSGHPGVHAWATLPTYTAAARLVAAGGEEKQ